jgi:hypothetical protein
MTIALTAYDASVCRGYSNSIAATVNLVEREVQFNSVGGEPLYAVGESEFSNIDIPGFMHPIIVQNKKEPLVAFDVRSFGRFDKLKNKFILTNGLEYTFSLTRAKMQYRWATQSPNYLRDCSTVPVQIFAQWISESVARRFALDPGEQLKLMIVAAIYYQSCFDAVYKVTKEERVRLSTVLSRSMYIKPEMIYDVAEEIGDDVELNLTKFVELIEAQAPIRLKGFNIGMLQTIVSRSWFNSNGPEILCVALEHPPTWIAVLVACAMEKTYHNSQIAKFLQRKRPNELGDFIKVMTSYTA